MNRTKKIQTRNTFAQRLRTNNPIQLPPDWGSMALRQRLSIAPDQPVPTRQQRRAAARGVGLTWTSR